MKLLPEGYIAVQSTADGVLPDSFRFGETVWAVRPGINIFATAQEAADHAYAAPTEQLPGLPELSGCPTLLFSAGEHLVDGLRISRSVALFGQGVGISPNRSFDGETCPQENPARGEGESVLTGTFYRGMIDLTEPDVRTLIFDGFTSRDVRFRDLRTTGGEARLIFRNLIHRGPCGHTLYYFSKPRTDGGIVRNVTFSDIRLTDFDDLDYGNCFVQLTAARALFERVVMDHTGLFFGLTDLVGCFSNAVTNVPVAEYTLRDCWFGNLGGGIRTACRELLTRGAPEVGICLTVENTVFYRVGIGEEPVLSLMLANSACRVSLRGVTVTDPAGGRAAAIRVCGKGRELVIGEDCRFDGFRERVAFDRLYDGAIPTCVETRSEAFRTQTEDSHIVRALCDADFAGLERHYAGKRAYYGDLHVHTQCGGTSDGTYPMEKWVAEMDRLKLDFAAVVDHRQMRGYFLPEWSEERFMIGTEPATRLQDLRAGRSGQNELHYLMLFPHKYSLAMVLANFPEFRFHGDELTGRFRYPDFTRERMAELSAYVQSIGGILVHAHPKVMMASDDPLDYDLGEGTFIETIYGNPESTASLKDYQLWEKLLALGKRIRISGGSDTHGGVSNRAVSTFYTAERSGNTFFEQMRSGDFTVGAFGLQMLIGDTPMGTSVAYRDDLILALRAGDPFRPTFSAGDAYELRILTDRGVAYASTWDGEAPQRVALQVERRAFYRAEIFDLTKGCRVAIGNPIWLDS